MESSGNGKAEPVPAGQLDESGHFLVMLRWVLIIAIAYVLLFSHPLSDVTPAAAVFIALYLGSNICLAEMLRRRLYQAWVEWCVVGLDVVAITVAIYLTGEGNSDLFVLYFVVLFLSALADGVLLAGGAALFIGAAHLYTASGFVDAAVLIQKGYMVRIPFLFAVALFFGNLVQRARIREREARSGILRAQRMELLSTVSHDLRNPLGVIDSLTGLLLDGDAGRLNPDQAGLVQRIRLSIRQVLHLSNNLIDAERIELNSFSLRLESCDLRAVVEETLIMARTAAALKGVSLTAELPSTALPAEVDAVQIERAISNLLGNAIKFTPVGGAVRVALQRQGRDVRIEVTDSGPGLPEALMRDLGRKHLLGGQTKGTGSGLGVFIAAAVSRAHGGQLTAANRREGGAMVALEIPLSGGRDASEVHDYAEPHLAHAG
jgi:signal transduction histidine kinase